jgi:hypothetical protein
MKFMVSIIAFGLNQVNPVDPAELLLGSAEATGTNRTTRRAAAHPALAKPPMRFHRLDSAADRDESMTAPLLGRLPG